MVALGDGAALDLGDLSPPASARVEGRVLLPPGLPALGLVVEAHALGRKVEVDPATTELPIEAKRGKDFTDVLAFLTEIWEQPRGRPAEPR